MMMIFDDDGNNCTDDVGESNADGYMWLVMLSEKSM